MYEAEGDSLNHDPRGPCFSFLYCIMALYTKGIRPSIFYVCLREEKIRDYLVILGGEEGARLV